VPRVLLASAGAWPSGVDAAAVCDPASQVGGDFFDVQERANQEVAFTVGDVSGHGTSAALLMSMVHGAINSGSAGEVDSPDRTVVQLNRLLVKKSTGERFASLIWCVYDPKSGRLRYVNAGHPPGLVIRQGEHAQQVMRLAEGGPVLGVLPDAVYQSVLFEADEGDLVVLYSDGIVETTNRQDEYYGEGRLLAVIEEHRHLPANEICNAILRSVNTFSERRAAADDRTVLAVRLWRAAD
jgi:sigma-B regulation protein RsbU (phosphoserine phosphatase)